MRRIALFSLLFVIFALTGCGSNIPQEPTEAPTEQVFMPTRSVATLPVATKAPACENLMAFIGDVNYAEPALMAPGQTFLKEWEVQNIGNCDWGNSYKLFFVSGDTLGADEIQPIPEIRIGEKGIISIQFTAPQQAGEYHSAWKLFGSDNRQFGDILYVDVTVQ